MRGATLFTLSISYFIFLSLNETVKKNNSPGAEPKMQRIVIFYCFLPPTAPQN